MTGATGIRESAMARVGTPNELARRLLSASVLGPVIVLVAVVGAWQLGLFHAIFGFKTFTVPYPDAIVEGIDKHTPRLQEAVGETLPAAAIGYLLGIGLGVLVASALVLRATAVAGRIVGVLTSVNALPIAAVAPLLALWVGAGFHLKVLVVAIMTVPTMVVYTLRGLTTVDPTALELMASYEANAFTIYRSLRIPTALPFILTAMKSCVVLALIGTIVTEVVTGFRGLGFVIVYSLGAFQTVLGWLALLTVAGLGITWYLLVELLERVVVPWDSAVRRGE
jgi:NitT/TauT family transport system permease protein